MSFGNAVCQAVIGDAAELVDRLLGQGERALLADPVEELASRLQAQERGLLKGDKLDGNMER